MTIEMQDLDWWRGPVRKAAFEFVVARLSENLYRESGALGLVEQRPHALAVVEELHIAWASNNDEHTPSRREIRAARTRGKGTRAAAHHDAKLLGELPGKASDQRIVARYGQYAFARSAKLSLNRGEPLRQPRGHVLEPCLEQPRSSVQTVGTQRI
nr:hypothetical protein [Enhygromyxa salina]